MKKLILFFAFCTALFIAACTKEGPAGKDGADGQNGKDGTNDTTCKQCHNAGVVDMATAQFKFSKHHYGEAAFEEAGNVACAPCHESEAFKYVCENNIPSTFTLNPTTSKYVNDFSGTPSNSFGEITCNTCHSSLHTTYGMSDLTALTTVAPVPMTMWAGAKTANVAANGAKSNLCIKCHQPRPFTASAADGNVLDYASIASNPTGVFFDPAGSSNKLKPGYRTHTHYGTAGAIYAGVGGVEFAGTEAYESSTHTTVASCVDCHMAPITGASGGHTFKAKGNFNGCNADGCHSDVDATSTSFWTAPRAEIKGYLDQLAGLLQIDGVSILNKNPDSESNLWVSNTTGKFDGYLNVYDPINNPDGPANNGNQFQNLSPSSAWSADQKAYNLTLPKITLTNAQMGSIINFQLCLRDYSLGIHNMQYTKALLKNSIAVLD